MTDSITRRAGRFFFGRIMPRAAYPVASGPLRGARFVLGSMAGEGGGASVYFNRIESEQTEAMMSELGPGRVFFDIGANVGYYTILASRLVGAGGAVVACEPAVRNLAYLYRHVEINRAVNVRIAPFACSDRDATASFSPGPNIAMGRITDEKEGGSVLVPTITLDSLSEKLNLEPDVLKIDVEGAEMDVFKGASNILRNVRPVIFLSTHSPELRESCRSHLRDLGYQLESLMLTDDPHEFLARPSR